jgi:hypothetical protein
MVGPTGLNPSKESPAKGPMGDFDQRFYVVPGVDVLSMTGPD